MSELDKYAVIYKEGSQYDQESLMTLKWYSDRVVSLCNKGDLLELGLGFGLTTVKFSKTFRKCTVVEGSQVIIDQFNKQYKLENLEIIHSYFEEFETNDSFDVIVMGFVLEHVDNPVLILKRFRQYLKASGRLYIAVPNAKSLHRRFGVASGILKDFNQLSEYDIAAGHNRYYDMDSISRDILQSGYHITKMEGIFIKPFTTAQLKVLDLPEEVLSGMLRVGIDFPDISNSILLEARKG